MPRLLFVSYWLPPRSAVGSIRAAHLLKHLGACGWDVTAVTARLEPTDQTPCKYIQTGYWDLKGAIKAGIGIGRRSTHEALHVDVPRYGARRTPLQRVIFGTASLLSYPDDYIGWLPFAAQTIRRLAATRQWDAVLTSAPPMTVNLAAALSHPRIPWIADFRDLWAGSNYSERSVLHDLFDGTLERLCVSRAAALVASSQLSADRLARRYPHKPCVAISTGFDPDEWNDVPFATEPRCTLLYAGTWYRGQRDPTVLFAAIRQILDEGSAADGDLNIELYAPKEAWLDELIARFRLQSVVRVHGFVERSVVLAAERRADRLIALAWDGAQADGIVPGKIFEYFGARRPILAIGGPPNCAVQHLLDATGTGVRCRTVEETKAEVLSALVEHRSGNARIIAQTAAGRYTAEQCARAFAHVLNAQTREHREERHRRIAITVESADNRKNSGVV